MFSLFIAVARFLARYLLDVSATEASAIVLLILHRRSNSNKANWAIVRDLQTTFVDVATWLPCHANGVATTTKITSWQWATKPSHWMEVLDTIRFNGDHSIRNVWIAENLPKKNRFTRPIDQRVRTRWIFVKTRTIAVAIERNAIAYSRIAYSNF